MGEAAFPWLASSSVQGDLRQPLGDSDQLHAGRGRKAMNPRVRKHWMPTQKAHRIRWFAPTETPRLGDTEPTIEAEPQAGGAVQDSPNQQADWQVVVSKRKHKHKHRVPAVRT